MEDEVQDSFDNALKVYRMVYAYLSKEDLIFSRELSDNITLREFKDRSSIPIRHDHITFIENLHDMINLKIQRIASKRY